MVLAFDTLVVGLTFYKTFQLTRLTRRTGTSTGLSETILRDGEPAVFVCKYVPFIDKRYRSYLLYVREVFLSYSTTVLTCFDTLVLSKH